MPLGIGHFRKWSKRFMRHAGLTRLRLFIRDPLTQLVVGLILVGTGTADVIHDILSTKQSWRIGVHHGVIVLGLMQILQNVPQMVEGFERWFEAVEVKDTKNDL
jgi:hypothetical protein